MNLPAIPLEVILTALFFALPLLGNILAWARKRRQPPATGDPTRPDPTRPDPGRPAEGTFRADTGPLGTPTPTSTPTPQASGGGWLEEAQRRVREAQRAEDERKGRGGVNPRTRPQTPVRPPEPTRTSPTPPQNRPQPRAPTQPRRPERRPEAQSLETRSPEARRVEARSLETRSLEARSLETLIPAGSRSGPGTLGGLESVLGTAPPLAVQRLGGNERARLSPRELRFDERELTKGFIWHQILSPPLSKSRRIRLSRRQP